MLKERIAEFVDEVRIIDGVDGSALISKDGIMIGKSFSKEISEKWFAAMSASALASAESAASIISITPPVNLRIDARDGSILLHDAGDKLLLVAVLNAAAQQDRIIEQLESVAHRVREAL
jgi:predicted regulator of Ras-like GTPase activity (Roadblock/LC7/MglB family)